MGLETLADLEMYSNYQAIMYSHCEARGLRVSELMLLFLSWDLKCGEIPKQSPF
jgi:hypothetical protein